MQNKRTTKINAGLIAIITILNLCVSISFAATTNVNAIISAPEGATVQVFKQIKNYYTEEILPDSEEDGRYAYSIQKSSGSYTYRVSMEGKLTKAGYLNASADSEQSFEFDENSNPQIRPDYDVTTKMGEVAEDNILLNINKQNYKRLDIDEEFKVRAYRAWQIVNNTSSNVMIEPDFHYNIISGDSISLNQQGQNAVIKGVKNGVSIVEVTYDAIEIGGNTTFNGIYGAIDPQRKGMFVVNVGGDKSIDINMSNWDSDMDTVYFSGDSGEYSFKPVSNQKMTVKCNDTEIEPNEDGSYILHVLQGNNIVSVTAADTTEYMIIKGNKLTVNVRNITSPDSPIKQGDKVGVSFKGLHMPMPKFAGVYNPGYMGTMKISYSTPNNERITSGGTQYNFINNHELTFNVYEQGTLKLTNGYIPMTSMGLPSGMHREITDEGIGANFTASEISADFSQLPSICIDVLKNDDLSYLENVDETYCGLSKVSIIYGTGTFTKSFSFSKTTVNDKATFSSLNASYPLIVTVNAANIGVNMEFRYWEEGDLEKKTAVLLSGLPLEIGTQIFSGDKTINMEIAVTPTNPIYGEGKLYSYVAYKTTTGFNRPILKQIDISDSNGNALAAPYGILHSDRKTGISYTNNEYYCYIPDDIDSITMDISRLNGVSDVTVGDTTQSVGTTTQAFTVPITGEENEIDIEVDDGRTYKISFIKRNGIYVDKIACDGDIAVVTINSDKEKTLDIYSVSYYNDKVSKMIKTPVTTESGANKKYIKIWDLKSDGELKMFVWGDDMFPYAKTTINE